MVIEKGRAISEVAKGLWISQPAFGRWVRASTELAFYDALAENESAREVIGDEILVQIAKDLTTAIKNNWRTLNRDYIIKSW